MTGQSVWDLLADALKGLPERPANSITADEFARVKEVSISRASQLLRADERLAKVQYRRDDNRPGVCFVPREQPCQSLTASQTGRTGKKKGPNGG